MVSAVDVCNLALGNIRAGSINSLDESSVEAQQCKLRYPILRDRCLREIPWNFNRKIKPLSLLTTEIFNWAYSYQYPTDCLKIHRLIGSYEEITSDSNTYISKLVDEEVMSLKDYRNQIPYEVFNVEGAKVIGTDTPDLRIDYAAEESDVNLFSDDFVMALSHLLASELAVPIVGAEMGRALRSDSLSIYKNYLQSAIAADQNDQYFTPSESDFTTVRR